MKSLLQKKITTETVGLLIICLTFFLIRLPPLYLSPVLKSLFYSHNIARGLILVGFVLSLFANKKNIFGGKQKWLFTSIGVYFLTQSLSVVSAQNLTSFLRVYKDVVLSFMYFYASYVFIQAKTAKLFLNTLLLTVVINTLFQISWYALPVDQQLFSGLLREDYLQFTNYEFNRGRYFGDFVEEVFLAILYIGIIKYKWRQTLFSLTACGIIFITIASSWRIKILMLAYTLIISAITYARHITLKMYIYGFIAIIFLLIFSNYFSLQVAGQNIVDRIIRYDKTEKEITKSRLQHLGQALYFGTQLPLGGIGLGNYYDNLSLRQQQENDSGRADRYSKFVLIDDPHNIFMSTLSYTGITGFVALSWLLLLFFYRDYKRIIQKDRFLQALVIAWWGLFLFAFFNPWMYFSFMAVWFGLRAIIEKIDYEQQNT